jgi:hypothetical protein
MKKTNSNKFLCGLVAIFGIVAIFVEYAPAFNEEGGTALGNVFKAMFGASSENLATVWPLVLAFCGLLLGLILAFAGLLVDGKALKYVYLADAILYIAAGVLFLFMKTFYVAANGQYSVISANQGALGSGTITTVVFAFLSGASAAGGFLLTKKD